MRRLLVAFKLIVFRIFSEYVLLKVLKFLNLFFLKCSSVLKNDISNIDVDFYNLSRYSSFSIRYR